MVVGFAGVAAMGGIKGVRAEIDHGNESRNRSVVMGQDPFLIYFFYIIIFFFSKGMVIGLDYCGP